MELIDNTFNSSSDNITMDKPIAVELSYNDLSKIISNEIAILCESLKTLKQDMKLLKKLSEAPQSTINDVPEKKKTVPSSVTKLLSLPDNIKLSRSAIVKHMYKYIEDNNLREVNDTRTINPNKELKELFNLNDDEQLSFYNIQTHIKKLYSGKNLAK